MPDLEAVRYYWCNYERWKYSITKILLRYVLGAEYTNFPMAAAGISDARGIAHVL